MRGRVDRIDADPTGGGLFVIDYKSGKVPSSKRIGTEEGLQLPLYLLALGAERTEGTILGGAYLSPSERKRSGIVLEEQAHVLGLAAGGMAAFRLLSGEDAEELYETVRATAIRAAEAMRSGVIAPLPDRTCPSWCDLGSACRARRGRAEPVSRLEPLGEDKLLSSLDNMRLSEAQSRAVLDASPRVLVAAGAGSGKTSLLVAYYVHALLDEGVPVESLVAVTFTRKAAGELADRIRRDLQGRGRHDLARALDSGTIGTIHSLCRRILRQNALQAGVDPAFAVLEADAAMLLKREAAAEVWEEAVLEADDPALGVLAGHERTLRAELVPLYDRLRGIGREEPLLILDPPCPSTPLWDRLEGVLQSAVDVGQSMTRRTLTLDNALGRLSECLEWAASVDRAHPSADDFARSSTFFPARGTPLESHLQPVREALTACRHALAHTQLVLLTEAMNRLLARFHQRYEGLKRQRGVLDFADLELRTHALLSGVRSECRPVFGERSRVMIDEFQDTNELQCSILESLGSAGVLMVGDERQSIYRFRGADVEVFASRRDGVMSPGTSGDGREDACRLHSLDINYRSRAEVLAFINHLFAQEEFFGRDFVTLQCGVAQRDGTPAGAACGNPAEPSAERVTAPSAVEVLAVERGEGEGASGPKPLIQQAEAQASAWAVERLLRDEGWEPRDLVILSPALTYAELYRYALRERNIPAYVVRGKGYYSREEIADVRCLLQVLVNPHDDLALVTVLRSPLAGLSDDALYLLGRSARREGAGSLWLTVRQGHPAGLPAEDRRRLDELVTRLTSLRRRVGRPGHGVSHRRCHNRPGLRRTRARFRRGSAPVCQHPQADAPGRRIRGSSRTECGRLRGGPGRDGGCERPGRERRHPGRGGERRPCHDRPSGQRSGVPGGAADRSRFRHARRRPLEFRGGQRGARGCVPKGSRRETYEEHDLCWGPAVDIVDDEKEKDRREDVRLLYVAMTRAKERLVLVGASPEKGELDRCRLGRIIGSLGLAAFLRRARAWLCPRCMRGCTASPMRLWLPLRRTSAGRRPGAGRSRRRPTTGLDIRTCRGPPRGRGDSTVPQCGRAAYPRAEPTQLLRPVRVPRLSPSLLP